LGLPVAAQHYPDRTVKIINPFPGGPTDVFARIVAKALQAGLEQPVIVEGKPGAGGTIGVATVAKSPADGYTLLVTSASTQIVQPVVRKSTPYDAEKNFIPIASTGLTPQLIVVHPSVPATTLPELIDYARANPETLSYGSSGNGTALHMAGEVFSNVAGVKLLHVPYKGAGPAVTDLLGGQVKMMFDSVFNAGPHIRSGKLRGIAVMGAERVPGLPDIKTTAELGMPTMRFYNFLGVYAPAGTPPEVIDRISKILRTALVGPETRAFYEASAMPPTPMFGAELAQSSRLQREELAEVVRRANLPLID
jgi:tripartite-type tricarboxylate transporter receptor subunit TctC